MDDNKGDVQETKIYTEKEHKGIITDLQNERSRYQDAQFNLDQSKRENESLKKRLTDLETKSNEKTELTSDAIQFEGKDEDYATVKDVKLGFKSLEKEATATFKKAQIAAKAAAEQEMLKEKFDQSCADATTKYANLASIGLDFKTVYQVAIRRIGRNKYEELAIFHSRNPGEALYKKGCEDPEIKTKLDLEENQELLRSMETRKIDKEILTKGTKIKSDEFFTPKEVTNMSTSEAAANMEKIDKSIKHWQELKKQKK